MPDFIYCSDPGSKSRFAEIHDRYFDSRLTGEAIVCAGRWGAVLTSGSLYEGFQPFEDEDHVAVVHGGPVLNLPGEPETTGPDRYTRALLTEALRGPDVDWFRLVGGPFALLIVDKQSGRVRLVSDVLGMMPIFSLQDGEHWIAATKLTPINRLAPTRAPLDPLSACEFVLHGSVAFPHCVYAGVQRVLPGLELDRAPDGRLEQRTYWSPGEENPYRNIDEAAEDLRDTMLENVRRVVTGRRVGMFLSGGEDSRTVMAATPRDTDVQCFTLADTFNRESRIAEKAAKIGRRPWILGQRHPDHYIKDFDYGCRVIGSETCLDKMHFLGMPEEIDLLAYDAVVGGTFSDFLLQGYSAPTVEHRFHGFRIWPSREMDRERADARISVAAYTRRMERHLTTDFAAGVCQRQRAHFEFIRTLRPSSATEWWNIWPASQTSGSDQFLQTTRCFRSYEPFNMNNIVAIGCAVPLDWKLNRRLFHRSFHGVLGRLGWFPHPDGWLPALGNWGNICAGVGIGGTRFVRKAFRKKLAVSDYSWPIWAQLVQRPLFRSLAEEYKPEFPALAEAFRSDVDSLLFGDGLEATQKLRLLQTLHNVRESRRG